MINFEVPDFEKLEINFDMKIDFGEMEIKSRIHKPAYHKPIKEKHILYEQAVDLSKDLGILKKGERVHCLLSGSFIFGDLIEAYIVENDLHVKNLKISTLSMSLENTDSLANLINGNYVDELNLLVSSYFWGHERWKLIPYIFEQLDIDNKFQLAVSANHCKIVLIETHEKDKIIIHGSSNLRSSNCIEQMCIENNDDLFDFYNSFFEIIVDKFQTIDKEIKGNRGGKLWQALQQGLKKWREGKSAASKRSPKRKS